jgi:hypothetical protein
MLKYAYGYHTITLLPPNSDYLFVLICIIEIVIRVQVLIQKLDKFIEESCIFFYIITVIR